MHIREDHPESVLTSMQKIMVVLLEESEDVQDDLLLILLSVLGRNRKVSSYWPLGGIRIFRFVFFYHYSKFI